MSIERKTYERGWTDCWRCNTQLPVAATVPAAVGEANNQRTYRVCLDGPRCDEYRKIRQLALAGVEK